MVCVVPMTLNPNILKETRYAFEIECVDKTLRLGCETRQEKVRSNYIVYLDYMLSFIFFICFS
jgi:hypothetical protein